MSDGVWHPGHTRSTLLDDRTIPVGTAFYASMWQLNVKDFPPQDVTDERLQTSQCRLPTLLALSESQTAGRCHGSTQAVLPAEPWSPGSLGILLSGLAPGLHGSNALKPWPPDGTFPADIEKKFYHQICFSQSCSCIESVPLLSSLTLSHQKSNFSTFIIQILVRSHLYH